MMIFLKLLKKFKQLESDKKWQGKFKKNGKLKRRETELLKKKQQMKLSLKTLMISRQELRCRQILANKAQISNEREQFSNKTERKSSFMIQLAAQYRKFLELDQDQRPSEIDLQPRIHKNQMMTYLKQRGTLNILSLKNSSKGEKIKQESKEEVKEEDKEEENTRKIKARRGQEVDYEILDKKYPIIDWKTENLGTKPQFDESKRLEEINMNVHEWRNSQCRKMHSSSEVYTTLMTDEGLVVHNANR
ncbi:hypothetical protein Tco_0676116 [Tanacetum coccineum]